MKAIIAFVGMVTFVGLLFGTQQTRPQQGMLRAGDAAPNFTLKYLNKNEYFELKSNLGKRPTILIFGSYT